jgi:GSH-dependent disulfide-bond oxidoreductase
MKNMGIVRKEMPGLQQGIRVPVKVDNILNDEEASKKFRDNASRIMQR